MNPASTFKLATLILKDYPVSYIYVASVKNLTEFEAKLLFKSNSSESEREIA
jgi:hypothetical protein